MSYQKSSKKEYAQPPPMRGTSPKRFKPSAKSKAKDYGSQLELADESEKSE